MKIRKFLAYSVIIAITMSFNNSYGQTATTNPATNIGCTSVILNATLDVGGGSFFGVEFEYADNLSFTGSTLAAPVETNIYSNQSVTITVNNLAANQQYYFRIKVGFSTVAGTPLLGSVLNFTTLAASIPTVSSGASVSAITVSSGALNTNNVSDNNGSSILAYGICWNNISVPTVGDNVHEVGTIGNPLAYSGSLTFLNSNTIYYVRAYATNGIGTAYGSELVFKSKCAAPTAELATNVEGSSFTVNWTAPGGGSAIENYYLDIATDIAFTSFPILNGITYNNYNVGTSTFINISGANTTSNYYYRLRAYNDGGADGDGSSSANSNIISFSTFESPPSQATDLWFGTLNSETMELSWTNGDGDGRLLLMKVGGSITDPINGTAYAANTIFGSGSEIGTGTFVVYKGTGSKGTTNTTVINLSQGVVYYFKVVEYNGAATSLNYNISGSGANMESSALPIELISFNAQIQGNGEVIIDWITASETNNDFFTIEKSIDLKSWTVISTVKGAGNSSYENNYSCSDNNQYKGISYYRLKQTDYNGSFSYSDIVFVKIETNENVLLFDQPFKSGSDLKTTVYNQKGVNLLLEIVDQTGCIIYTTEIKPQENSCPILLNMNKFSKGLYFLRVSNNLYSNAKRFLNN